MFSPRSEGSNITQERGKQDDVSSRCHRDKCVEERGRMYTSWGGGGTTVCVCVSAFCRTHYLDHKVTDRLKITSIFEDVEHIVCIS